MQQISKHFRRQGQELFAPEGPIEFCPAAGVRVRQGRQGDAPLQLYTHACVYDLSS